jgi:hypothetical protein
LNKLKAVKRPSRGNKPRDERFAVKKKRVIYDVNGVRTA